MPEILSDLPRLLTVLVRKEFLQNLQSGQGEYIEAHLLGVRCQAGSSLQFQVRFQQEGYSGIMFCLPLQAICWQPCELPFAELLQPWDTFSSSFAVHEFGLLRNSNALLLNFKSFELPARIPAKYLFTLDFQNNALADCFEQHKQLHFLQVEGGWFAAVPNNRLLCYDSAFGPPPPETLPQLVSLAHDFCGECSIGLPLLTQ